MLKKYNLFFLTILSIIFIDKIPKIKDDNITKKIPNQLIVIWEEKSLKLS